MFKFIKEEKRNYTQNMSQLRVRGMTLRTGNRTTENKRKQFEESFMIKVDGFSIPWRHEVK